MHFAKKSLCLRVIFARLLTLLPALISLSALGASAGFTTTALDRYVQAPDDNYRYDVIEVVSGKVGGKTYKTYIVEMISQ